MSTPRLPPPPLLGVQEERGGGQTPPSSPLKKSPCPALHPPPGKNRHVSKKQTCGQESPQTTSKPRRKKYPFCCLNSFSSKYCFLWYPCKASLHPIFCLFWLYFDPIFIVNYLFFLRMMNCLRFLHLIDLILDLRFFVLIVLVVESFFLLITFFLQIWVIFLGGGHRSFSPQGSPKRADMRDSAGCSVAIPLPTPPPCRWSAPELLPPPPEPLTPLACFWLHSTSNPVNTPHPDHSS